MRHRCVKILFARNSFPRKHLIPNFGVVVRIANFSLTIAKCDDTSQTASKHKTKPYQTKPNKLMFCYCKRDIGPLLIQSRFEIAKKAAWLIQGFFFNKHRLHCSKETSIIFRVNILSIWRDDLLPKRRGYLWHWQNSMLQSGNTICSSLRRTFFFLW